MQFLKDCFIKSKFDLLRNDNHSFIFRKTIFLILVSFIFLKCSNKSNVDLETLSKAYVDILVIEDYYQDSDSTAIKKSEIFLKYDIDSTSYYETFKEIKSDKEKWDSFFTLANTYLETLKASLKNSPEPAR